MQICAMHASLRCMFLSMFDCMFLAFISNFSCEMTITYLQSHHLYLPDCYSVRLTTLSNYHLIDWLCDFIFSLFTWWFDSRFFLQQFDTRDWWNRICINYLCHQLSPSLSVLIDFVFAVTYLTRPRTFRLKT